MDLVINLDRTKKPVCKQLLTELRRLINDGVLQAGTRLPSSRDLANSLKIARTTVIEVYEQLIFEGYIKSYVGRGTFIIYSGQKNIKQETTQKPQLSSFGQQLENLDLATSGLGGPDISLFPWKTWHHLSSLVDLKDLNYPNPAGYWPLRQTIANYLNQARGLRCEADQVIVVSGSQQGIEIVSRLFISENDEIAIEDPGYLGSRQVFLSLKAKIRPIAVDQGGLIIKNLHKYKKIKLIYTTPSHQFPTGTVMSLQRRQELLEFANKANTLIIEDDYDSEFRYDNATLPALHGLDKASSVIYIGTFSKILLPGLRIGYLVVPDEMVGLFTKAKKLIDRGSSTLEQMVLNRFIREGYFIKHIKKMRKIYSAKKEALITFLEEKFGNRIKIIDNQAGLHLMIEAKADITEELSGFSWNKLDKFQILKPKSDGIFRFLVSFSDFGTLNSV